MAFNFKTRSPVRDTEADTARFSRLTAMFDDLLEEMEAERAGLQARYQRVADSAAFSLEEFENEQSEAMSSRTDELSDTLMACSKRLQSLQDQAAFIQKLRDEVVSFKRN